MRLRLSTSFQRCMGGSGICSAVGAVVGLSGRWEASNLLQFSIEGTGILLEKVIFKFKTEHNLRDDKERIHL
jgi:hypothetical protein